MNGAPLALGLAGLLAGASALARRGSRNAASPYVPEPSAPVRGAWWRDADGARWTQAHDTLVRDALDDWKGDPSQIRLHMQDELSGAAMPGSGSGKIARARARALLWEIQNKARATPPLFRGALRQEGEWLSWTTSRRVAETFARKGGGQVIRAQKGCKGLRVADYLGQDPERQWILQESARAATVSGSLSFDRSYYMQGACDVMGIALHRLTGLPISALWDGPSGRGLGPAWHPDSDIDHVVVMVDSDSYLDATGLHRAKGTLEPIGPARYAVEEPCPPDEAAVSDLFVTSGMSAQEREGEIGLAMLRLQQDPKMSVLIRQFSVKSTP